MSDKFHFVLDKNDTILKWGIEHYRMVYLDGSRGGYVDSDSHIINSFISEGSTITRSTVRDSKVTSSYIRNSGVADSKIFTSGIKDSSVFRSDISCVQVNGFYFVDALISDEDNFGKFCNVGSENGDLVWYADKDADIMCNRGCFKGTLKDFEEAVEKTHGNSKIGKEYKHLIGFIKLRAGVE